MRGFSLLLLSLVLISSTVFAYRESTDGYPSATINCPLGSLEVEADYEFIGDRSYCGNGVDNCTFTWDFNGVKDCLKCKDVDLNYAFLEPGSATVTLNVEEPGGANNNAICTVTIFPNAVVAVPDLPLGLVILSALGLAFFVYNKEE